MNDIPQDLMRLLENNGVETTGHREINYGTQYHLSRGPEKSNLNVYHTGKVSVDGKSSSLKDLLENWRISRKGAGGRPKTVNGGTRPTIDPTLRLGIDEAGKGDYFGPLVVAGVRISGGGVARKLREIGVRDSKDLSDAQATRLAILILDCVGPDNVYVVAPSLREYEARRNKAGNINRLLGEIDVEIMAKLEGEVVVVDEFAKAARSYIEPHVPTGVRLEVRVRAEDDAAVAAASILARARYLEELGKLSEMAGSTLPKGSTHVLEAGRRVFRERGEEGLSEVAKTHFSITEKITGASSGGSRRKRGIS